MTPRVEVMFVIEVNSDALIYSVYSSCEEQHKNNWDSDIFFFYAKEATTHYKLQPLPAQHRPTVFFLFATQTRDSRVTVLTE